MGDARVPFAPKGGCGGLGYAAPADFFEGWGDFFEACLHQSAVKFHMTAWWS